MAFIQWLKVVWSKLIEIKYSFIAFLVCLFLSILSMGAIGLALLYLVIFMLPISMSEVDQISGDWFWPAIIMVSLMWSFGFLIAGNLNLFLESKQLSTIYRRTTYLVVLWCWAYLLWYFVLSAAT